MMMSIKGNVIKRRAQNLLLRFAKSTSLKTGLMHASVFNVYKFMHDPHQLEFLLKCLRDTNDLPGSCLEVGCAQGATTIFLNKFLKHMGSNKRYIALDTFAGFISEDANFEIQSRGKDEVIRYEFANNQIDWVAESLKMHDIADVELIQGDASSFSYEKLGPLAFCLFDIDLYKPTAAALPHIYKQMTRGGIIIVDDCRANSIWDGALQAYEEFIATYNLSSKIVCDKYGIIKKS